MAIEAVYLDLLKQVIDSVKIEKTKDSADVLCVAYPDLLVPQGVMDHILGPAATSGLSGRADAAKIWSWHGLSGCSEPLYETLDVFRRLNLFVDIIDIVKARGFEKIVDLNNPLPEKFLRKYDIVIDTGTCEHCFNVGQAFVNCCDSVCAGGYFIHAAPLTKSNHGFWNFSPTVYPDFFGDNGFSISFIAGVKGSLRDGLTTFDLDLFSREQLPSEAMVYVVAKREHVRDLTWPIQRKYRV